MAFYIDKYKVTNLSQVEYNKNIFSKFYPTFNNRFFKNIDQSVNINYHILNNKTNIINKIKSINNPKELYYYLSNLDQSTKNISIYDDLPNLLINGNISSGKKTFIKLLLQEIYGNNINYTTKVKYSIVGYSNTNIDILIEQSNYHIVIEPNNTGFDKYVIQEIVKEYAKKYVIPIDNINPRYKIVLINNVDNLSYYAQTSLRCTMEKYYNSCKFILCGKQISKIIDPIRSRCLNVILPNPKKYEIFNIMYDIIVRESININNDNLCSIINYSKGNLKTAIWLLELHSNNIHSYIINYKLYIFKIIKLIKEFYYNKTYITIDHIKLIRNILYTIFINNISGTTIIKELLEQLLQYCYDFNHLLLQQLICIFSFYEARVIKGKRIIIHIEAMINSLLYHIVKFKI